ncbi:MAG: hypothetical protein ACJ74Y_10675 [Bryobacteraceae bacterium]
MTAERPTTESIRGCPAIGRTPYADPGSKAVPGMGFGVSPKQSFLEVRESETVRAGLAVKPTPEVRAGLANVLPGRNPDRRTEAPPTFEATISISRWSYLKNVD